MARPPLGPVAGPRERRRAAGAAAPASTKTGVVEDAGLRRGRSAALPVWLTFAVPRVDRFRQIRMIEARVEPIRACPVDQDGSLRSILFVRGVCWWRGLRCAWRRCGHPRPLAVGQGEGCAAWKAHTTTAMQWTSKPSGPMAALRPGQGTGRHECNRRNRVGEQGDEAAPLPDHACPQGGLGREGRGTWVHRAQTRTAPACRGAARYCRGAARLPCGRRPVTAIAAVNDLAAVEARRRPPMQVSVRQRQPGGEDQASQESGPSWGWRGIPPGYSAIEAMRVAR